MMISTQRFTIFVMLISLTSNRFCYTQDVINSTHTIKDGETLISSDGSFELGFFSPSVNSKNRYIGIWYKKITSFTVVWVANRDHPLTDTSGAVLKVIEPGILALLRSSNDVVWSSNTSRAAKSPVAQLLESGNFVVKEANDDNPDNFLWQSFDYPTDTLLPGMKFGKNLVTGHETYLSSWKNSEDPGTGDYTYHLDPTGYPQTIMRRLSVELYRTGPWNGVGYSGLPGLKTNSIYTFQLVIEPNEVYYHYQLINQSMITRFVMNQSGLAQRWAWIDRTQGWGIYLITPVDNCDSYRQCGAYGNCNVANSPICGCLDRFVPRYPQAWAGADWSNGCVRRVDLDCRTDGFLEYNDIKLPDTNFSWFNASMNLEECKMVCLRNCSCMAYSNLDIRNGGSGCLLWFGELLDIRVVYDAGQTLYVRMAASELGSGGKKGRVVTISLTVTMGLILLGVSLLLYMWWKKKIHLKFWNGDAKAYPHLDRVAGRQKGDENQHLVLPLFDLSTICKATNNFSSDNKIGEGGFGPVYKGKLEDGREIAVKRLSRTSTQGVDQFKNEVSFLVKLQHRNLVKLLGCCIRGEDKMLIYEYMSNRSLDLIVFDETKNKLLDWRTRFNIISGIARGLMYLHEDSRLRIIHRDLKVSNILLDMEMNPKISDFGMARAFGRNEIVANTTRVVGTYGYMSPEYAIDGLFSVKSDVFSFGVIVLEIVSGKRNRGFTHRDHYHNLLGHAWMLYREGKSLELVDSNIDDSCNLSDVLRSIHVGLLCVQKSPDDRPSMSSVVFMLENELALPDVKQPGFFTERDVFAEDADTHSTNKASTVNEITITMLDPR